MRKIKFVLIFLAALTVFTYGFIKVNSNLPAFIKDNSSIKTYCKTEPFDLIIEIKDYPYYIQINKKAIVSLKDDPINSISRFMNNTSNKLLKVTDNVKEKTKNISNDFLDNFIYRKVQ